MRSRLLSGEPAAAAVCADGLLTFGKCLGEEHVLSPSPVAATRRELLHGSIVMSACLVRAKGSPGISILCLLTKEPSNVEVCLHQSLLLTAQWPRKLDKWGIVPLGLFIYFFLLCALHI